MTNRWNEWYTRFRRERELGETKAQQRIGLLPYQSQYRKAILKKQNVLRLHYEKGNFKTIFTMKSPYEIAFW